jgi:hypothetical protein
MGNIRPACAFALLLVGCFRDRPLSPSDCNLEDPAWALRTHEAEPPPTAPRNAVDLSALKLYRNTFLVDRVGPYAHHFTIWYRHIEPNYARVRAWIDPATGRTQIAVDDEAFGGIAPPRPTDIPMTPEVADLADALDREVRDRCPAGRKWVIRYEGQYREVDLVEMMSLKPDGAPPVGFRGFVRFPADESLMRPLAGPKGGMSGFGDIAATEPMQWVDFVPPPESMGTTFYLNRLWLSKGPPSPPSAEATLMDRALEAARRLLAHQPSPPLADILAAQGPTLLPQGIDQPLAFTLTFYARPRSVPGDVHQQQLDLTIGLKTAEVVHGGVSRGEASGTIAGIPVKATAALTAFEPLGADAPSGSRDFVATLQLHVEDDQGHAFDRIYPAKALVIVDGNAVATGGFGLLPVAGAAAKPNATDAFHGALPARGPYSVVDFYFFSGISADPRR